MKKIAIDLTWVRHKKIGGTESYIRNLLSGIAQLDDVNIKFVLLVTYDNIESFRSFEQYKCFELCQCAIESSNQIKRILWQNLKMGKLLKKAGITVCFEPVYGKPFLCPREVKFYTVIHDLQAIHYPKYFSNLRVLWMKLSWWNTIHTSEKIIAISNYVKNDIIEQYHIDAEKIKVIYNAINIDIKNYSKVEELKKYGLSSNQYYYSVSSLLPHKNLKTLIMMLGELKRRNSNAFYPLIVSGIGGKSREELEVLIKENQLQESIIFTNFIDNSERNLLYKYCKAFLFPSVFEGFGMPPIEAMAFGVPVVTTKYTSLLEVTGGLATYVENALDPMEWCEILEGNLTRANDNQVINLLSRYTKSEVAKEYINLFNQ